MPKTIYNSIHIGDTIMLKPKECILNEHVKDFENSFWETFIGKKLKLQSVDNSNPYGWGSQFSFESIEEYPREDWALLRFFDSNLIL